MIRHPLEDGKFYLLFDDENDVGFGVWSEEYQLFEQYFGVIPMSCCADMQWIRISPHKLLNDEIRENEWKELEKSIPEFKGY